MVEDLDVKIVSSIIDVAVKKVIGIFSNESVKIKKSVKEFLDSQDDFDEFDSKYGIKIDREIAEKFIIGNIKVARNWANEVSFYMTTSKIVSELYVDVDFYLTPIKYSLDEYDLEKKIKGKDLIKKINRNILIYGGAGAGKTTFLKSFFTSYSKNYSNYDFSCAHVIRFRSVNYPRSSKKKYFGLYSILLQSLGISIRFPVKNLQYFESEYFDLIKGIVIEFIEECKLLIFFDGFDEIPDLKIRKRVELEFNELAYSLINSKFILTSRSNDFNLNLPNTDKYEVAPLNDVQIKSVIKKWLKKKDEVQDLYTKIKESPFYDASMRPLTLSYLCAIYEKRKSIPPKPRYIYDFVLNLLLENWDQQRGINRYSEYANFYIEKKKEFLAHLAFKLSNGYKLNVFNSDILKKVYNSIHEDHNLPLHQSKNIIKELESHTSLFIQSGFDSYQFSHKSLQEFLTAKYISSIPKLQKQVFKELPNELAIAVCLTSNPNIYFEEFLKDHRNYSEDFWNIFLSRLSDELPDFTRTPSVLLFFFMAIEEIGYKIFRATLLLLIEKTNIKIGFENFLVKYPKSVVIRDSTRFEYIDLNVQLKDREYFPGIVVVKNDILTCFK
ncbi:NACHT domain-containing protein [Algoriphagus aestuarii]|nr:NACHT domain-containing protein [Algoriphagus aestuarii]